MFFLHISSLSRATGPRKILIELPVTGACPGWLGPRDPETPDVLPPPATPRG